MGKFFVEIGAANFETLLPLAKSGWHGFVVEPVPALARDLERMFEGTMVNIIEAAISDYDGEIEMAVSSGYGWAVGISHVVSSNHLGAKLNQHPENAPLFTETIKVKCMTLNTLLRNVNHIDLMKVDAEGHETNIFNAYDFRVKPMVLKIEHKHIDDIAMSDLLTEKGYLVWTEKDDIYAVI